MKAFLDKACDWGKLAFAAVLVLIAARIMFGAA